MFTQILWITQHSLFWSPPTFYGIDKASIHLYIHSILLYLAKSYFPQYTSYVYSNIMDYSAFSIMKPLISFSPSISSKNAFVYKG